MVSDFATKYGILILEYLWIPIIVPILALLAKFVFSDKLLFIKEIKKVQDSDVEQFTQLYNARIDDSLRICVEEILRFVGEKPNNSIEIFCENWQNPVKQRITPHFLTTSPSNYYEFTTKE